VVDTCLTGFMVKRFRQVSASLLETKSNDLISLCVEIVASAQFPGSNLQDDAFKCVEVIKPASGTKN
jgi:hypothetical protein